MEVQEEAVKNNGFVGLKPIIFWCVHDT